MKALPKKQDPLTGTLTLCEPQEATHVWLQMKGCFSDRLIPVQIGGTREGTGNWSWNGDTEKPTLRPSILSRCNTDVCHSWVTDGMIQYLGDSTHEFANQTLPLLDVEL